MDDVRLAPFVKCPGCGGWIATPRAASPALKEENAFGDQPVFELRDSKGGGRLVLARREMAGTTSRGRPGSPVYDFALKFSDRINATAGLRTDIGRPLLRFLEDLAAIEGDWSEERSLRDADRQFSITCCDCYQGEVRFEVSLAAEFQDPAWTVELALCVKQGDLPEIVAKLRKFLAASVP
jgi:hypothetical protein